MPCKNEMNFYIFNQQTTIALTMDNSSDTEVILSSAVQYRYKKYPEKCIIESIIHNTKTNTYWLKQSTTFDDACSYHVLNSSTVSIDEDNIVVTFADGSEHTFKSVRDRVRETNDSTVETFNTLVKLITDKQIIPYE